MELLQLYGFRFENSLINHVNVPETLRNKQEQCVDTKLTPGSPANSSPLENTTTDHHLDKTGWPGVKLQYTAMEIRPTDAHHDVTMSKSTFTCNETQHRKWRAGALQEEPWFCRGTSHTILKNTSNPASWRLLLDGL